jgi:glyoxylase-like metal-dependent hydrolase (beta-lactamase superfamily II)/rhodanese-related sulfurtransferase
MEVIALNAADLGNRSYVVTDGTRAIAIDPPRPPSGVVDIIESRGLLLEIVVETHLHNDHVSGGPELAEATGAAYAISAEEEVEGARGIVDGERFTVGTMGVEVVATPGHTKHHQAFVVTEGDDCVVFTGGSLLIGTVGRTDLFGSEHAAGLARQQWASVRHLLNELPGSAVVHPTHGFGSFCSATPCVGTETTIEAERRVNAAAQLDRRAFVTTLLAGFGEYPRYFSHIAARNRAGIRHAPYREPVPTLEASDLAELPTRVWVIDVRPRSTFAAAHVPGTINIGVDGPLATYLGWTMPWGSDFALVAGDEAELTKARHALAHIGLDLPIGTSIPPTEVQSGFLRRAKFAELATEWSEDIAVIDVRRQEEWDSGHLKGAHHLPVHRLMDADLPPGRLWLYCAAGYRAVMGASLLRRSGRDVVAVDDGWRAAKASRLSISTTQGFEHRLAS